jgi:hypothetical protein
LDEGGANASVGFALCMATLNAVCHDRILTGFCLRLRTAGKKPLVAITAFMRKLRILMNRLLKMTASNPPTNPVATNAKSLPIGGARAK